MKSAEAVTPKHPDKLCDQVSDAILDACLEQDPDSRVAIEVLGGHGIIELLDLKKPQFEETARWGHMGNHFRWDN